MVKLISRVVAESVAKQQSVTFGQIRSNSAMQNALRNAGFDETFLAKELTSDVKKLRPGQARKAYLELGSRLLDAMPAQKKINAAAEIEELLEATESSVQHSST